jgi:gliding motility-associated-like protein
VQTGIFTVQLRIFGVFREIGLYLLLVINMALNSFCRIFIHNARMTKFTFKSRSFIPALAVTVLTGAANMASGQIMFNNGAQIWTGPQAVVQVNGGLTNDGATGVIDHNGTMTIASNPAASPGTFTMSNGSNTLGNGVYRVEQDWVNNATFTANNSNVELFGNLPQMVTGTNSTTFDTLILTGTGTGANRVKSLVGVDATIDATGALIINDRELATDVNTMFVLNPDPNAVTNNTAVLNAEGFVSSIAPGTLSRVTNSTSNYLFPTGSSLGTLRYRPVMITPTAAAGSIYTVRLVNNNPDNDGFLRTVNDNTICNANPNFYHAILRTAGTDPSDVEVAFLPAADGAWDGMSHWRTTNNMWNDMSAANAGTLGSYSTRERTGWLFANPGDPYVLTELSPAPPVVSCVGPLCAGSDATITVTGGTNYTWTLDPGMTVISGMGTDSLSFNAGSTGGVISVVATSPSGLCTSAADSCIVIIAPSPTAGFDTIAGGPFNNSWAFIDSSSNGSSWFWDFGDGTTSTSQNPMHNYEGSGTYNVTQIVTSSFGCTDTILSVVTVNEGILIPNVFSPDGDGINDQFYIPNSGLKEFSIEIFNRWGIKVFESTADEIRWDGVSTSGVKLSDGTYYFILKAVSTSGKDYSTTGFLTLLAKK